MARITPQQRQRYGPFLTGSIPGDVMKAIDDRELEDRLAQASGLMQRVAKAATPGAGRQFGEQAQRILSARPRARTEQIVVAKMAKARALGNSPQAADLTRQAREELLLHPPAVRRFDPAAVVRKAKAGGQMLACFDQTGKLWGVCDPDDVEVVDAGDPGQAPADQASPAGQAPSGGDPGTTPTAPVAQVAKSAKGGKRAIFDQQQRLIGMIDPELVTPVITDVPGAKEAIGKARARVVARAQGARVAKTAPAGHVAAYDEHGRLMGYARPEDLADPAAQARNRGPVSAGGTNGLGAPRGEAKPLPGDMPGRTVVKAAQRAPRTASGRVALLKDLPPRSARGGRSC
jgi:hypothetical protein